MFKHPNPLGNRKNSLSQGYDKKSSLDASITVSLSSPRMKCSPGAKNLLSIMSILPDGLSDAELLQSKLAIEDILACKAVLLGTSLAYTDNKSRLKCLAPIREYVKQFYPPPIALIQPLTVHYHALLTLHQTYYGTHQMGEIVNQAVLNLGNLHQVLQRTLHRENSCLADAIKCAISFSGCSRIGGHGATVLLDSIPALLPRPSNHQLEALFITEVFFSIFYRPISNPDILIDQGMLHFNHFNDLSLEAKFHLAVGHYHRALKNDPSTALRFFTKAFSLAESCGDGNRQIEALASMAKLAYHTGKYFVALTHARLAQRLGKLHANLYGEAQALWIEGMCCRDIGDYKDAISQLHRSKDALGLCGVAGGHSHHLTMVDEAQVHLLKSEYVEARSILSEIVRAISPQRDPNLYAHSMLNFAEIGVRVGDSKSDVLRHLDAAKMVFQATKDIQSLMACDTILADLHLRDGDLAAAKMLFRLCIRSMSGIYNECVSFCMERLADVTRWGSTQSIAPWAVVYLAHARKSQEKLAVNNAFLFLGDVFLSEADEETAHSLFVVALEGFTALDVHRSRAQCMTRLGDLANKRGDISDAMEFWKAARPLFERSLQGMEVTRIDSRLSRQFKELTIDKRAKADPVKDLSERMRVTSD
ncbi:ATPase-AAA-core domain-containing protein [Mycena venus]|uniref:ATPase-AAA-core domain-containing protein n=1 Tax=Mycena venus TaxID=2733690 RepID=A0A8H6XQL4_9AGAR|nr:ATPase-AAA-core domain-containing protein [Mycena venus]